MDKIVRPLKLINGMKILDLGCGRGFQSQALFELGFNVLGTDLSKKGISIAKNNFLGPSFIHSDASDLDLFLNSKSFDIILSRGMSWFHYELNGINKWGIDVPNKTKDLFKFIKRGGIFILMIVTDFSGVRPENSIHNNKLEDYVNLFKKFGKIIFVSDFQGRTIRSQREAGKLVKGIIIATRKNNLNIIIVI